MIPPPPIRSRYGCHIATLVFVLSGALKCNAKRRVEGRQRRVDLAAGLPYAVDPYP